MKWEDGRLTNFDPDTTKEALSFFSGGEELNLKGRDILEVLDSLGREGWELISIETGQNRFQVFRNFWMKRPFTR
jgi:hypothetical protein